MENHRVRSNSVNKTAAEEAYVQARVQAALNLMAKEQAAQATNKSTDVAKANKAAGGFFAGLKRAATSKPALIGAIALALAGGAFAAHKTGYLSKAQAAVFARLGKTGAGGNAAAALQNLIPTPGPMPPPMTTSATAGPPPMPSGMQTRVGPPPPPVVTANAGRPVAGRSMLSSIGSGLGATAGFAGRTLGVAGRTLGVAGKTLGVAGSIAGATIGAAGTTLGVARNAAVFAGKGAKFTWDHPVLAGAAGAYLAHRYHKRKRNPKHTLPMHIVAHGVSNLTHQYIKYGGAAATGVASGVIRGTKYAVPMLAGAAVRGTAALASDAVRGTKKVASYAWNGAKKVSSKAWNDTFSYAKKKVRNTIR